MGKDRDLPFDQKKKKKSQFDDPRVCHYHLVAFCPHDLFPNTRSDLGPCEKIHDDGLRADFLNYNKVLQYEAEFLGYLERLISELERKIRRSHEWLEKEMLLTEHACANSDCISLIAMEVQSLLKQAEREGEDGLVDQAQATMDKLFQVAHRMVIILLRKAGVGMGIGNTAEARREAAVQITAMIMRQRERGKEKETRRGIGVIMTERKTDIVIMTGVE